MESFRDNLLRLIREQPGLTDRQLADLVAGRGAPPQRVNAECRRLASERRIRRERRADGWIGNHPAPGDSVDAERASPMGITPPTADPLSEDALKRALCSWLESQGWRCLLDVAQLRVTYDDTKDLPPSVCKFDVQVEDATRLRFRVAVGTVNFQAAPVFAP